MVSRESVDEVFLPNKADCLQYVRRQRWSDEVTCPHCESADTAKKGTTKKDAQRYKCHSCDTYFNDLTGTIFADHRMSLPDDVKHLREMQEKQTTQITQQLDRSYRSVLDFVHEVQDALNQDAEFELSGVCEADEIYVTAGEKGIYKQDPESPCERGLTKRDAEPFKTTNRQS
jgi:transposase-like protein